jgi:hypothetical protein
MELHLMKGSKSVLACAAAMLLATASLSHAATTDTVTAASDVGATAPAKVHTSSVIRGNHCASEHYVAANGNNLFRCVDGKWANLDEPSGHHAAAEKESTPAAVAIEVTLTPQNGAPRVIPLFTENGKEVYYRSLTESANASRSAQNISTQNISTGVEVEAIPYVLENGDVALTLRVNDRELDTPHLADPTGVLPPPPAMPPSVDVLTFESTPHIKSGETLLVEHSTGAHPMDVTVKVKVVDGAASTAS